MRPDPELRAGAVRDLLDALADLTVTDRTFLALWAKREAEAGEHRLALVYDRLTRLAGLALGEQEAELAEHEADLATDRRGGRPLPTVEGGWGGSTGESDDEGAS